MIRKTTGSKSAPAAPSRRSSASTQPKAATKSQATAFKRDELSTGRGGALRANAQKYLGAQIGVSSPRPPPPQRTSEIAIAQAKALFVKTPGTTGAIGGAVTDFRAVTDKSLSVEAQAQLEKNKALEQKAVAALSKADQQRYTDVQTKLVDPTAKLAMQTMLLEGRLPGEKDLRDGKTLLQQLDGLSKQKFAPELAGADQILEQTVKEVFIPAAIGQGVKNTCGATSAGAALAVENPAEYVRLIAGLASPEGTVVMANGDSLVREPGTLSADPAGVDRSVTQRLFGPAAMEYANGSLDYDNERDISMILVGGMTAGMEEHLLEGLLNRDFTSRFDPLDPKGLAEQAIEAIDSGESPVAVTMGWPNILKNHILMIDRVERTDEGTFVVVRNPWGQEERLPYDTFKEHLNGVVIPTEQVVPPSGNWA
ncbi:MAG: hypothetical protein Q8L48_15835 [Archangium sp.]|nr:hypothetical protein [Archangium sp.]